VTSGSKLHVTIGHTTVLATVTFFGHKELYNQRPHRPPAGSETGGSSTSGDGGGGGISAASDAGSTGGEKGKKKEAEGETKIAATSLLAEDSWELPNIPFEWGRDFYWQDELARGKGLPKVNEHDKKNKEEEDNEECYSMNGGGGEEDGGAAAATAASSSNSLQTGGIQWCFLSFDQPVFTTMKSLLIASRLETENAKSCRIAFYGRLVEKVVVLERERVCVCALF
jgi:hypothetical protein